MTGRWIEASEFDAERGATHWVLYADDPTLACWQHTDCGDGTMAWHILQWFEIGWYGLDNVTHVWSEPVTPPPMPGTPHLSISVGPAGAEPDFEDMLVRVLADVAGSDEWEGTRLREEIDEVHDDIRAWWRVRQERDA